eukprot:TRINITY_DN139_c0_g6_i3.p1 TRINITY_DN139_c0_g6~~TRINITY_DN139_c0_g6_i3.p1  ORF type:complete len:519 (-),score=171.52 TRINITY_DN139_c0_g6_i3:156-1712(-)
MVFAHFLTKEHAVAVLKLLQVSFKRQVSTQSTGMNQSHAAQVNHLLTRKQPRPDLVVGGLYKLKEKLGYGSFGDIYAGEDPNGVSVAIKFEALDIPVPQLEKEVQILRTLDGVKGVAKVYYFGREEHHLVMVMDRLGPSLEEQFARCGGKLSIKSVMVIGLQCLDRLEAIHKAGFIYRDIKPENFLTGPAEDRSTVYVIDFGLAKRYIDPVTKQHIPYQDNKNFSGNARFASLNSHLGIEQSRRDDLESLGFMLLYLFKGSLPWQGIKASNMKEKFHKIKMEKERNSPREITANDKAVISTAFSEYFENVRLLNFDEDPDYSSFKSLLLKVMRKEKLTADGTWDWDKVQPQAPKAQAPPPPKTSSTTSQITSQSLPSIYVDDDRGGNTLRKKLQRYSLIFSNEPDKKEKEKEKEKENPHQSNTQTNTQTQAQAQAQAQLEDANSAGAAPAATKQEKKLRRSTIGFLSNNGSADGEKSSRSSWRSSSFFHFGPKKDKSDEVKNADRNPPSRVKSEYKPK